MAWPGAEDIERGKPPVAGTSSPLLISWIIDFYQRPCSLYYTTSLPSAEVCTIRLVKKDFVSLLHNSYLRGPFTYIIPVREPDLLLVYVQALSLVNVPMIASIRYSHVRATVIAVIKRLSLTGHHIRESVPVLLPVILSPLLW